LGISNSISRLTAYYTRHGFRATIRRAGLAVRRALFASRMVVYYCDLAEQASPAVGSASSLQIVRLRSEEELSKQNLQEMTGFWNPQLAHRNIKNRFAKGASLWLVHSENRLAGYGWTLQGGTIEPYYFPLGRDDVHLFDFHVFSQYRGQGINPCLVTNILRNLATDCGGRAFIEAAEWNEAQLASLRKTPFRRLGWARSFTVFGHTLVSWVDSKTAQQMRGNTEPTDVAVTMGRPHHQ
jgi:hypothetical protein